MRLRHACIVATAALATVTAALVAGCSGGGGDDPPDRLLDGSPASSPPVELEGVDDPVLTKVRLVPVRLAERSVAACLRGSDFTPSDHSVERTGVSTESVTFGEIGTESVYGCNHSAGAQDSKRRWCGSAYGRLYSGRLRDPRLDILCGTAEEPVGFAWITPGESTRYVSVEQPGYVEVYEVAGDLPVRVATVDGVVYERFAATFDVLEHSADGRLLRDYRLKAAVAG